MVTFEGHEVTVVEYDEVDDMYLIDDVPGTVQPQWIESSDDRLRVTQG